MVPASSSDQANLEREPRGDVAPFSVFRLAAPSGLYPPFSRIPWDCKDEHGAEERRFKTPHDRVSFSSLCNSLHTQVPLAPATVCRHRSAALLPSLAELFQPTLGTHSLLHHQLLPLPAPSPKTL